MAKKRKSKESTAEAEDDVPPQPNGNVNGAGSDSEDDSSSDDDSLVLEGTLIRNPDASDSDDDDEDDISSEEEEDDVPTKKKAKGSSGASSAKKSSQNDTKNNNNAAKKQKSKQQQAKKKKSKEPKPETIEVEFLFCDMQEQFFHGMKTLIHRHSIHASHSSQLSDLIIENEMVGTVLSSDIDPAKDGNSKKQPAKSTKGAPAMPPQEEANVFGFASIINVTTNHSSPCIQSLKATCLKHCPAQHKAEMETVLSGKTKRPAGFFFQERMVNVPLEITEVLHHQLILDMDHAVKTADDETERKSLDFGAFVRIAPCFKSDGGGGAGDVIYKYFDDEVFATNAEFVYNFEAPKHYEGEEEELWCSVIVMTKTGHRGAMKELKKMIHGGQ